MAECVLPKHDVAGSTPVVPSQYLLSAGRRAGFNGAQALHVVVAQQAERHLAKVEVAGSIPVSRSG